MFTGSRLRGASWRRCISSIWFTLKRGLIKISQCGSVCVCMCAKDDHEFGKVESLALS